MTDQATPSGGDLAPPATRVQGAPPREAPTSAPQQPAANPRASGFRPAPDWRERVNADGQQQPSAAGDQQQPQQHDGAAAPQTIDVDGTAFTPQQVREAIAHKIEQDARAAARPQSWDKYEVKLPADFQAPQGVNFQFDQNDPLLKTSRELAQKRGLTQEEYSDFLGVYAATKIGEYQRLCQAREAQRALLGSAVDNRINAIETWMRARIGADADLMVRQLKTYPVAAHVRMFEGLMRQFSDQGGATPPNGGRVEPDNSGKIEGYAGMSYAQRRAAQDAANARRGGR